MKVISYEYPKSRPFGMVVVEIRDDLEAEYEMQAMPRMNVHYAERNGRRIPVFVEIEVTEDPVEFERGGKE